ncbi:MAG: hypothetical protein S0880_23970, partial [Actinomycetota bacterium]|nr:hypothetical protein [Actinomycetota bacterium]
MAGDGSTDGTGGTTREERNRELRRHLAIAAALTTPALLVPAVLSALDDDTRLAIERTLPPPVVVDDGRVPLTAPRHDDPNGVVLPRATDPTVAPTAAERSPSTAAGASDTGSEPAAPLVLSRPVPLPADRTPAPIDTGEEIAAPPTGLDGNDEPVEVVDGAGDDPTTDGTGTTGDGEGDDSLGTAGGIDPIDTDAGTTTTVPEPDDTEPGTTTTVPEPGDTDPTT